jgi:transcription elongation factor Elf1
VSDRGNFKRKPFLGWCLHRDKVSSITAGLERSVCERCGHVAVRYVADTVKVFSEPVDLVVGEPVATGWATCGSCEERAEYLIPIGVACAKHAWAEAVRQDEAGYDLWVPIKIDRNARRPG